MKILILLFTSLSVSLDSFFCGLTLAFKTTAKLKCISVIATTVFCLCFLGSNIGILGSVLFEKYSTLLGGLILCFLSFKKDENFLKNDRFLTEKKDVEISFIQSFLIGFSIGIDGMVGCISLTLMGFNFMLATLTITIEHVLLLLCAFNLSTFIRIKNEHTLHIIPSSILLILGTTKLLSI
ncbi:MAG: manganese efflux pump [Clostridia bacterium]|nr:manganese efflux pump [Clostridia bacterium]